MTYWPDYCYCKSKRKMPLAGISRSLCVFPFYPVCTPKKIHFRLEFSLQAPVYSSRIWLGGIADRKTLALISCTVCHILQNY